MKKPKPNVNAVQKGQKSAPETGDSRAAPVKKTPEQLEDEAILACEAWLESPSSGGGQQTEAVQ
jgi:hypothetical protein